MREAHHNINIINILQTLIVDVSMLFVIIFNSQKPTHTYDDLHFEVVLCRMFSGFFMFFTQS